MGKGDPIPVDSRMIRLARNFDSIPDLLEYAKEVYRFMPDQHSRRLALSFVPVVAAISSVPRLRRALELWRDLGRSQEEGGNHKGGKVRKCDIVAQAKARVGSINEAKAIALLISDHRPGRPPEGECGVRPQRWGVMHPLDWDEMGRWYDEQTSLLSKKRRCQRLTKASEAAAK